MGTMSEPTAIGDTMPGLFDDIEQRMDRRASRPAYRNYRARVLATTYWCCARCGAEEGQSDDD